MRRRRFLAASLSVIAGCTATGYRESGPRTPPPAPETETSSTAPVEERAQAVVRPLNDLYRTVRGPLGHFEVDDVGPETIDRGEESLTRAREALTTFEQDVPDPPARYRSFPSLLNAHARLFDALAAAVECWSALSDLDSERAAAGDRLDATRSKQVTLANVATELRRIAEENPTVPASVFLTVDRLRGFAGTVEIQSRVVARLVEASEQTRAGTDDWRAAVGAFERDALAEARNAFDAARIHYRTAVDVLDAVPDADGSIVDLRDDYRCLATAGVEATGVGFDAVDGALAGDVARADRLLERAQTTRIRCVN